MDYNKKLELCLLVCEKNNASDVHIKAGMQPIMRAKNELRGIDCPPFTSEELYQCIIASLNETQEEIFKEYNDVDFSFSLNKFRYRCNAYCDINGYNLSIRRVVLNVDDFSSLGIPETIKTLALKKNGMILVTGPTGSGKSTTLACVVNYLNHLVNAHIVTLEDPIEFVHQPNTCLISQREIGRDTTSFYRGLTAAMRQDPDIILLGEMRDVESITTAISAAETGHLVLSTLHTKGAENTVDRIIDMFPSGQQNQIRVQLSMVLLGVFSQQLVPSTTPGERVLATEVMLASNAIKNLIRTGKTQLISSTLQTSRGVGMQTMDYCLQALYESGIITKENAEAYSFSTMC